MSTKSPAKLEPYLFYEGRCEEAIEFYHKAIGAETVMLFRFADSPEPAQADCQPPGSGNKIMHATIKVGETVLLVSDGRCSGKPNFQGMALSISVPAEADADRFFNALGDGGQVVMPLTKTFYSPRFGMVNDRFGLMWMIMVSQGH